MTFYPCIVCLLAYLLTCLIVFIYLFIWFKKHLIIIYINNLISVLFFLFFFFKDASWYHFSFVTIQTVKDFSFPVQSDWHLSSVFVFLIQDEFRRKANLFVCPNLSQNSVAQPWSWMFYCIPSTCKARNTVLTPLRCRNA